MEGCKPEPTGCQQAQVAVPLALGLGAMGGGQYGVGFIMLGLAALAALTFYLWCAPSRDTCTLRRSCFWCHFW